MVKATVYQLSKLDAPLANLWQQEEETLRGTRFKDLCGYKLFNFSYRVL